MTFPVRTYRDERGIQFVSRLDSWRIWYQALGGFQTLSRERGVAVKMLTADSLLGPEDEVCPWCQGLKQVEDTTYGALRCLCVTLDWQHRVIQANRVVQSYVEPHTFDEIELWGAPQSRKSLLEAVDLGQNFVRDLNFWMLMVGSYGCGKSHILQAIAGSLPLALFITAADFEQLLRRAFSEEIRSDKRGQEPKVTVDQIVTILQDAPVLLFDDLGMQYSTAWILAKLRGIIDYRYKTWQEHLTVVTTNQTPMQLLDYDDRIGSRMQDTQKVKGIIIAAGDYRRRARG